MIRIFAWNFNRKKFQDFVSLIVGLNKDGQDLIVVCFDLLLYKEIKRRENYQVYPVKMMHWYNQLFWALIVRTKILIVIQKNIETCKCIFLYKKVFILVKTKCKLKGLLLQLKYQTQRVY